MLIVGLCVASTWHKRHKDQYIKNVDDFRPSVVLPVNEKTENIFISEKKLRKRISLSKKKDSIEPLTMTIRPKTSIFRKIAKRIAKKKNVEKVVELFQSKIISSKVYHRDNSKRVFQFEKQDFKWIDFKMYGKFFGQSHRNLKILPDRNEFTQLNLKRLARQLDPYLEKWERKKIQTKFKGFNSISVDNFLLPTFARKMVKKYTIYRGPNCFHSALAFNNINIPRSSSINVKDELSLIHI